VKSTQLQLIHEKGVKVLHNPVVNKGTAFTGEERERLGLRGLLPPNILSQEMQVKRVLENLRSKPDDLERYIFLISLEDRNENLFYRVIIDHLEELIPLIYTPTVGKACQSFGHIFRRPRGLYICSEDRGHIREVLQNWPHEDPRIIVVTDGERILGLGDLGADGMGIPIGKLSLYTACAGIHPTHCLPVMLDVGTNNQRLLDDPLYLGMHHPRIAEREYKEFLDEFMEAVTAVFPSALVQLEDFATRNAFELLERYRHKYPLFDDDIQGTAAVALAGILSAIRIKGGLLEDERLLILGAGEAGIGIGSMVLTALMEAGLEEQVARRHCWFMDSRGLVCTSRDDLEPHKVKFAHDHPHIASFREAVDILEPTIIIGVSGQPGLFDQNVIEAMSRLNERPVIFALSNPTSKSECTAEQAYRWSNGRAIFAGGSPFPPVTLDGKLHIPGQGNNVYIFPGVGLGASYCGASCVTDNMFLEAARVLAGEVREDELRDGRVYPQLNRIRAVSLKIAAAVVRSAIRDGLTDMNDHASLEDGISSSMYYPHYPELEYIP
jgi:malate dehydrogenase (oxaloacetate-decarboxylating)(NADP+)